MSMRIQDAFSNCCEGIKEFAYASGACVVRTANAAGSFLSESASKVAEYVKPQFENLKTFAQQNRQPIAIAAIGFVVGAILTAIFTNICCKSQPNPPVPPPPPPITVLNV